MKTNEAGLKLIKSLEGCRLTAYKLKGETNYTIGYGHSDKTIKAGQTISQAEADNLLVSDLKKFEDYVIKYAVKKFPNMNENQFSALVSYCYNRGPRGLKQLVDNSENETNLGWNILVYWGSNKNYESALKERRKKEQKLYYSNYVNVPVVNTKNPLNLKVPNPVLRRGSRGMEVEHLQRFLHVNNAFCISTIDGKFGPNTYQDVYNFQKANPGCGTPDGVYGPKTYTVVKKLINS